MFHKSFTVDQTAQICQFYDQNGYVLILDVLTQQDCQNTTDEVDKLFKSFDDGFDIRDPITYDLMKITGRYGIPTKEPLFSPELVKNRNNPKIWKAFQSLYQHIDTQRGKYKPGQEDIPLIVNHDRVGFYRPTLCNGREDWKTPYKYPNVHLDLDPKLYKDHSGIVAEIQSKFNYQEHDRYFITENNFISGSNGPVLQGLISIWDNYSDDGGLQVVPGFHKQFDEWYQKKADKGLMNHKAGEETLWGFKSSDMIDMEYVHTPVRVAMPAGSIAIWDKRLAHGSVPNNSDHGRLIQFLVLNRKKNFSEKLLKNREKALQKLIN